MSEQEIRRAAQALLRELGPVHAEELAGRLAEWLGPEPEVTRPTLHRLLLQDGQGFAAYPLADGRLCDLDHLLDGLTLTHVLDEQERSQGMLRLTTDLATLYMLTDDGETFPLADGRCATYADEDVDRLAGPPGWLPDAPAVLVRIVDGAAHLTGIDAPPPPGPDTPERLRRTHAALLAYEGSSLLGLLDVPQLVVEARARAPRLLSAPDAPLSDLLAAAGVSLPGGGPDEDTDAGAVEAEVEAEFEALLDHLREGHGFTEGEILAVVQVLTDAREIELALHRLLAERREPRPPEELVAESVGTEEAADHLAAVLEDPELTLAVAHDVVGADAVMATAVLALLRATWDRWRDRRLRANAHWLSGRALELAADDHREAERAFRQAHEADAQHAEALVDLARYLSDRGQAGPALGLLRQVEGEALVAWRRMLERYARPGPMSAGRNDPCPCGSGRKHKACCQARGGWPLQERIDWLWDKIVRFAASPVAQDLIEPVTFAADSDEPGAAAMRDITIANLVMFEGGLLDELCELRGDLLPPDELDLLRSWQHARAGAYEVVEVDPAAPAVTLLDLTRGERTTVADHSVSRQVGVGDALLCWLLPMPEGTMLAGGVLRIPEHHRAHVLDLLEADADAIALARWYASLHAPPRLATTEGDPLTYVTRTYRVTEPEARAALATRLDEDGDALIATSGGEDGHHWLRGTVTVDDEHLVVSTSSATRAAWFADLIAELVPDADLVDEERLPAGEVARDPDADDEGQLDLDALEPAERAELEAELEQMMVRHEDATRLRRLLDL